MNIQGSRTSDEAKIRNLIDRRTKALHARDADAVLSCFAADFISFTLAPPLVSAMTTANAYKAWFATWQGPIGTESRDLTLAVSGDLGVSHSLNLMSGTSTGGHELKLWYRQTLSFRKVNGDWKISHEHNSVPFYMDGGFRAAVDLTP